MTNATYEALSEAADRVLNRIDSKNETLAEAIECVIADYSDITPRDIARKLRKKLNRNLMRVGLRRRLAHHEAQPPRHR